MEILSTRPQCLTLEARHTISLEVAKKRRLRVASSLFIPKIFSKCSQPTQEDNMNSKLSVDLSSRAESDKQTSATNNVSSPREKVTETSAVTKQNMTSSSTNNHQPIDICDPRLAWLRYQLMQTNKYTAQIFNRYTATPQQKPPMADDTPKPPAVLPVNAPQVSSSQPDTPPGKQDEYSNQPSTSTQEQEAHRQSVVVDAANGSTAVLVLIEPQIPASSSVLSQQVARDLSTPKQHSTMHAANPFEEEHSATFEKPSHPPPASVANERQTPNSSQGFPLGQRTSSVQQNRFFSQQPAPDTSTPVLQSPMSPVSSFTHPNSGTRRTPEANESRPREQPLNYTNRQPQEPPNMSPIGRGAPQSSVAIGTPPREQPNIYTNQQKAWQQQEQPNMSPVVRGAMASVAPNPFGPPQSSVANGTPPREQQNYYKNQQTPWQTSTQPQEPPNMSPQMRGSMANVAPNPCRPPQPSVANGYPPRTQPNYYTQPQEPPPNMSPIGRGTRAMVSVAPNLCPPQSSLANEFHSRAHPNYYTQPQGPPNMSPVGRSAMPNVVPNPYALQPSVASQNPQDIRQTRVANPPDYLDEETISFGHISHPNQPPQPGSGQKPRAAPQRNRCKDVSNNDSLPPKPRQRKAKQTVQNSASPERENRQESQMPNANNQMNPQCVPMMPPSVYVIYPPPPNYQPMVLTDEPYHNYPHPSMSMPNFMAPEIRYRPYQSVPRSPSMYQPRALPMLESRATENQMAPASALPASLAPADMAKWLSSRYQQAVPQPQQDYVSIERQLADYQQALVSYSSPQQNNINFMKAFCDQYANAAHSQRFNDNPVNRPNNIYADNRQAMVNYGLPNMKESRNQWQHSMNQRSMDRNSGSHQGQFPDGINMETAMPMGRVEYIGPSIILPTYQFAHQRHNGPTVQFPNPIQRPNNSGRFSTNISPAMGGLSLNEQIPEQLYRNMMNIPEYDPKDNH